MKREINGNVTLSKKKHVSKEKVVVLKEKTFSPRESLLTEMFKMPHLKNIYHLGVALFISLVTNTIVYDYIYEEKFSFGLGLVIKAFSNIHVAMWGWLCMSAVNLLVFNAFHVWAYVYQEIRNKPTLRKSWNYFGVICLLYYYWESLKYAVVFVEKHKVCIAGSFVILMETLRLLMKTHAFLRGNIPKILNFKEKSDTTVVLPTFKDYVYFLFIPTLIYRDEYPRSEKTHWKLVVIYAVEVLSSIMCLGFIFENYFVPVCNRFKSDTYDVWDFVWALVRNSVPSFSIMIVVFYLFLHSWMNMFAEITKFADRQFYQDWWNSTSFEVYYRKWNLVVHDWLYLYIYKDMHDHITPGNKLIPKLTVFLISSIFHEYVLLYALGIFYPALFIMFFFFGGMLAFIKMPEKTLLQVLFSYGYALGLGIAISAYLVEFCVRDNDCVLSSNYTFLPYEPRTYSSFCLQWK